MRLRNWVAGLLPPASAPNVGATGAAGLAVAAGAVAGVVAEADALAGAEAVAAELAAAAAVGAGADAFGEFIVPF